MEPEPMLTKKIWTNELKPVPWKKAEVWFMIHEQISTNKKSFRVYYSAAAVIFFMFFNIYQLQQIRIESNAANNQPSTISSVQTQIAEDNSVDQDKTGFTQSNFISQNNPTHMAVVQPNEVLVAESEFGEVDIQRTLDESIIISTEAMAVPQTVTPIVGVIQLPVGNMVSVKSKRKRLFHKLEHAENEFEVGYQNTIIIARIK